MGESTERREFTGEKLNEIQAERISLKQSAADSIKAERATLEQSSARQLEAGSANFDKSSVFRMQAENAVISHSAATFVRANEARLVNSNALIVKSSDMTVEGDLKTILHVGNATGNVHMIFDRDGALRFGLGLGAALVSLTVLVRRLFR